MKAFKHLFIVLTMITIATIITIAAIAYIDSRKDTLEIQREQVILDYYQDTEILLDSLCIYENNAVFNTSIGSKYLKSKYKFDSLIINDK